MMKKILCHLFETVRVDSLTELEIPRCAVWALYAIIFTTAVALISSTLSIYLIFNP